MKLLTSYTYAIFRSSLDLMVAEYPTTLDEILCAVGH